MSEIVAVETANIGHVSGVIVPRLLSFAEAVSATFFPKTVREFSGVGEPITRPLKVL